MVIDGACLVSVLTNSSEVIESFQVSKVYCKQIIHECNGLNIEKSMTISYYLIRVHRRKKNQNILQYEKQKKSHNNNTKKQDYILLLFALFI